MTTDEKITAITAALTTDAAVLIVLRNGIIASLGNMGPVQLDELIDLLNIEE